MNLAVISPAYYPEGGVERRCRMYLESTKRYGITTHFYGQGKCFRHWELIKIVEQLPELKLLLSQGFTHALYTDSRDAFFITGLDEIIAKYLEYGSPSMLCSADTMCWSETELAPNWPDVGTPWRYHCVGGYMGPLADLVKTFELLAADVEKRPHFAGDDASHWQLGWIEGWFKPTIDYECRVFQTTANGEHLLTVENRRVFNTLTGSYPCILHCNGGHSSLVDGKYDRMIPWWSGVYPDVPVTREECSVI